MSRKEVCEMTGLGPRKILEYMKQGFLAYIDISIGKTPRYKFQKKSVEGFLDRIHNMSCQGKGKLSKF